MILSKDKSRRIKGASVSQGLQGRETDSRPLLSPCSCCNKCGTIRETVKRDYNLSGRNDVGPRSVTAGKSPTAVLNEDSYDPSKNYRGTSKNFRLKGERNRSIGHTFDKYNVADDNLFKLAVNIHTRISTM